MIKKYLVKNDIPVGVTTEDLPGAVTATPELDAAYAEYLASLPSNNPAPYWVSKLKLRRALRAAGLEPAYDAFLAANPIHQADLTDAQELLSTDPLLVSAVPQLSSMAGIPEPQAWAIIAACKKDDV